jgi:hypothetical protein
LLWAFARYVPQPTVNRSFFASFFAKKEVLSAIFEWAHRGAVKQIPAFAIITDWDILFAKMC